MRAREFIAEQTESIKPQVERTLPAAWVIEKLQNNDFYKQYRFGVALAGAQGEEQRKKDSSTESSKETSWGENEVVISYAGKESLQKYLDNAMKQMGLSPNDSKLVTTKKNKEAMDTDNKSPILSFKGYGK